MAWEIRITGFRHRADPYEFVVTYNGATYKVTIGIRDGIEDIGPALMVLFNAIAAADNPAYSITTAETLLIDSVLDLYHVSMLGAVPTITPNQNGTEQFEVRVGSEIAHGSQQLAQVDGIYAARGRLGAWTYQNKIHWSSVVNPMDFTPSISTQANELFIKALLGNIQICLGHKEGFIIYSTGNIVTANYIGGQEIFKFNALVGNGVISPKHAVSNQDSHVAWTNDGLYLISPDNNDIKPAVPELTDTLAQNLLPIKIQILHNRFIVLNVQQNPLDALNNQAIIDADASLAQSGLYPESADTVEQIFEVDLLDSIVPNFPLYKTALLFDITTQKWGICNNTFKALATINPINEPGFKTEKSTTSHTLHNYLRGLILLQEDNRLSLCNDASDDAYLLFGNFRVSDRYLTQINKILTEFVNYATAQIKVYSTSDGRLINPDLNSETVSNVSTGQDEMYLTQTAKWFNIAITGKFNLKYAEIEAHRNGRSS